MGAGWPSDVTVTYRLMVFVTVAVVTVMFSMLFSREAPSSVMWRRRTASSSGIGSAVFGSVTWPVCGSSLWRSTARSTVNSWSSSWIPIGRASISLIWGWM